MSFYEICKVLVSTETAYKDGAPHAFVTSIDSCTQKQVASVEFDYKKVFDREDKYEDIAGFYHTHPSGMNMMSSIDIETMNQWVRCLGKSLICVIETEEKLNAWAFIKGQDLDVRHKQIQALGRIKADDTLAVSTATKVKNFTEDHKKFSKSISITEAISEDFMDSIS